jgi:valyl-tRNA synthetase
MQWWLRYPRVEEAKAAVRDGHIKFYPERWAKVYLHWLDNIQDWCISRQLWWGHRIPVWYRKGVDREKLTDADLRDPAKVHVSLEGPTDPDNWEQEEDVLDTWASSWLWPFATMGWPDPAAMDQAGFDFFYPTTTLVTAPDIIFFWVARMIMAGLEFIRPGEPLERRIPFRNVYFTGIIRDQQGRKMSKSLGNSPDPLDLIGKYGADGLRFGIISIAPQGQDIRFAEERIEFGKNFCNKLWNACRFRQLSGEAGDRDSLQAIVGRFDPARFDADDHAILDRLLAVTREVDRCFYEFEFSAIVQALYGFFWNDFCDWYVEVSKAKLQVAETKANCLAIQDLVLRQTLLLLHPFIPFITEELWNQLGFGAADTFLTRDARLDDASVLVGALQSRGIALERRQVRKVEAFKEFVAGIRQLKATMGVASRRDVEVYLPLSEFKPAVEFEERDLNLYLRLAGVARFSHGAHPAPEKAPAIITPLGTAYLLLPVSGDSSAEVARLTKELEKLVQHIAATEARLANPAFAGKAPPQVIEGARKQLADLKAKRAETERLLDGLS